MLGWISSDASAVAAVLEGDGNRFEVLVRRHFKDVQAVAFAYTRNRADAEDIAQEAFLRAFSSLEQLREPHNFRHWLLTITRNCAHQFWHRRQREAVQPPTQPAANDPALALQSDERRQLIALHLEAMEPAQREVLMLHYFAGRPTREIAALLGIERDAVKKRLERARAALGASLLKELKGDVATNDAGPRIRAVMAALVALPAARSVSAAAPSPAGLFLLPKAATVLLAAALGAGILLAFDRVDTAALPETSHGQPVDTNPPVAPPVANDVAVQTETSASAVENEVLLLSDASPAAAAVPAEERSHDCPDADRLANFAATPMPVKTPEKSVLDDPINMEFEDISLPEVLGFLGMQWKVNFFLDESVPRLEHRRITDGMIDAIDLDKVPVADALAAICSPLGLTYAIEPGFVWISTPAYIGREVKPQPESAFEGYDTQAALESSVSLEFEQIHISEAMNFLALQNELNIALDWRVIAPPSKEPPKAFGRNGQPVQFPDVPGAPRAFRSGAFPPGAFPKADDPVSGAMPGTASPPPVPVPAPSQIFTVPFISLKNVRMRDMLIALLRPLDLVYQEKPFGIVIGAHAQINSFTPRPVLESPSDTARRALDAPLKLSLAKPTVLGCLRAIRAQSGLCVRVDKKVVESLAAPFSKCEYESIPLAAALYFLSLQADQPMLLEGETLFVGAKSAQEVSDAFEPLPAAAGF